MKLDESRLPTVLARFRQHRVVDDSDRDRRTARKRTTSAGHALAAGRLWRRLLLGRLPVDRDLEEQDGERRRRGCRLIALPFVAIKTRSWPGPGAVPAVLRRCAGRGGLGQKIVQQTSSLPPNCATRAKNTPARSACPSKNNCMPRRSADWHPADWLRRLWPMSRCG